MSLFKKHFRKEVYEAVPPMPPLEAIVEMMYDKELDAYCDEPIRAVYSKDKAMRYVILKDDRGRLTYRLEVICQFDETEWRYAYLRDEPLPAMWQAQAGGASFFESEEELLRDMEARPEYKRHFG